MPSLHPLLVDLPRNPWVAVGLPMTLGFVSGFFTREGKYGPRSPWYRALKKPSGNPPSWAFGVVWPTLYACMGWSSHLMVKALDKNPPGFGRETARHAIGLYWTQLALNQAWSVIAFGTGNLGLGFIDLAALTGTVGYLISVVKDVDVNAAYFLAPYLAWISYASYLNASLWWHNFGKKQFRDVQKKGE